MKAEAGGTRLSFLHRGMGPILPDHRDGMPKGWDDSARQQDWCGVYRLGADGKVTLLTKEMSRPNGMGS